MSNDNVRGLLETSLEAIDYQAKSMLFQELTAAITNLVNANQFNEQGLERFDLAKIISKHTGLALDLRVLRNSSEAFIQIKYLDKNSPLLQPYKKLGMDDEIESVILHKRHLTKITSDLRGQIDINKGKVGGVFSKVPFEMYLGDDLLKSIKLTPSEVAAVILHEVGHAFTSLETLVHILTTNMAISSAIQSLNKTNDDNIRLEIVHDLETTLDSTIVDPLNAAYLSKNPVAFTTLVLRSMADKKVRSSANSETYDLRSFEFLADQFAARQGAGRDLAIALDKLHGKFDLNYRWRIGSTVFYIVDAVKLALGALTLGITNVFIFPVVFSIFYLTLADPEFNIYDNPVERLTRIKNDMVQSLKNKTLSADDQKKLLGDIDVIDSILEGLKSHRSIANLLWISLTKNRRNQHAQIELQKELEGLINNDLFIKAAKLQSIA